MPLLAPHDLPTKLGKSGVSAKAVTRPVLATFLGDLLGKPYARELELLSGTYTWACAVPVDDLAAAIRKAADAPLLTVGSGGSLTVAVIAAALHRYYTGASSTVQTPLAVSFDPQDLRRASVMLLTAGGRNPDVLGAFQQIIQKEPRRFIVVCASTGSPLSKRASKFSWVDVSQWSVPTGKDGFLATNSLLATTVILTRAYAAAYGAPSLLPPSLSELMGAFNRSMVDDIHDLCHVLWTRHTLVVLHGTETYPGAVDLESKLTEAALSCVQIADYRNFAHGRHHWLAKRGGESAVLAFLTHTDDRIAENVLALLPPSVPVVRLVIQQSGISAGVSSVVAAFLVAASAGRSRGIDPGDPGVPAFGRKIYHQNVLTSNVSGSYREKVAIERKGGATLATLEARSQDASLRDSYRLFVASLTGAVFGGVVLDYDGTVCDEANRFEPIGKKMAQEIRRLLRSGTVLGVATGRGKSVKTALRDAIPKSSWTRVVVGYYNGGEVGALDDDSCPDGADEVHQDLKDVADKIATDDDLCSKAKVTRRKFQITVEPVSPFTPEIVLGIAQSIIHAQGCTGLTAVRSSHSVDILAPGVSKTAVIDRVRQLVDNGKEILCIGDRGAWPGNDFRLLAEPHSLSVDEVSEDPKTGWNLAMPGYRGSTVTLEYLSWLGPVPGGIKMLYRESGPL